MATSLQLANKIPNARSISAIFEQPHDYAVACMTITESQWLEMAVQEVSVGSGWCSKFATRVITLIQRFVNEAGLIRIN
jgi:hypothetical protein